MDVTDATVAAEWIKCQRIVGVHYDTFGYIRIDHEQARKNFANAGLELYLVNIGETISI